MRDLVLRGALLAGASTVLLTESLSAAGLVQRGPLAVAWIVLACIAARYLWRRRPAPPRLDWVEAAVAAAIALLAATVGVAAALSRPNSADAMAYHMPRVVYWAQQASVRFFPTPYFNQICLQPMSEYLMLQTYVLSGGDRWINLLTAAAYVVAAIGVAAVAAQMGLDRRGQAIAALLCATLPNGILQASGAKNEWALAVWLLAAVYFTLREEWLWAGLAVALALGTKATSYLFLPPLLIAARRSRWTWPAVATIAAAVVLLNGPQYWRNWRLSGSPLGYDSAQGDGVYRWRNEQPGWRSTVSNALRHGTEQLGARGPRWNGRVFAVSLRVHRMFGLDPQDPRTTWPGTVYGPPRNANHEADANNRWHLLLAIAGIFFAVATRRRDVAWLSGAVVVGFLLFCFYLKWQPFMARLELPLFVLAALPAAALLERLRPRCLAAAVCLFLLVNTRLPLVENWTRPLKGPASVFRTTRESRYFADMSQWNNRASYLEAVDATARSGCRRVGIDIERNQLEYPFQALLRERVPDVQFEHVGVANASARYYRETPQPCAVLCLDCVEDAAKAARYAGVGKAERRGKFLLFLPSAR